MSEAFVEPMATIAAFVTSVVVFRIVQLLVGRALQNL
jgi:hypothetical protein